MTSEQTVYEYRVVFTDSGRVFEPPTTSLQLAQQANRFYVTPTHIERRQVGPWEKVEQ